MCYLDPLCFANLLNLLFFANRSRNFGFDQKPKIRIMKILDFHFFWNDWPRIVYDAKPYILYPSIKTNRQAVFLSSPHFICVNDEAV
jgi:hypothetical protein